jgi:predicted double-glycine peptidase
MMNSAMMLIMLALMSGQAKAGWVTVPGADSGQMNVKVMSFKERQFRAIVRQQYDYSCGSAALATLLTYQYDDPTSEAGIFKAMWEQGNQAKIKREGFSLLDLKRYLEARGYSADGYDTTLNKLAGVGIPAIVLIRDNGYNHFVVIKGIKDGKVAVGDPSLGARVILLDQFEKLLSNNIVFVINGLNEKAAFNRSLDWHVREKAPLGLASGPDNLANVTLLRRPAGDY